MDEIAINFSWKKGAGINAARGSIHDTVNAEQLGAIIAIIQKWPPVITTARKELPCTPR